MTNQDLHDLAWPAMRYALGRKTYVVNQVCSALIRNADFLSTEHKIQSCKEIEEAIEKFEAGMDMDVEEWKRVLEAFR